MSKLSDLAQKAEEAATAIRETVFGPETARLGLRTDTESPLDQLKELPNLFHALKADGTKSVENIVGKDYMVHGTNSQDAALHLNFGTAAVEAGAAFNSLVAEVQHGAHQAGLPQETPVVQPSAAPIKTR